MDDKYLKKEDLAKIQEIVRLKDEESLTWNEIGDQLGGHSGNAVKKRYYRYKRRLNKSTYIEEEREDSVNAREINSTDAETLDDLLSEHGVDLTIWRVDSFLVNKWQVAGKIPSSDTAEFNVQDLFQVKARLLRRVPILVEPVITPIEITLPPAKNIKRTKSDSKRALIVPDSQSGFMQIDGVLHPLHDRQCMDIILQMAQEFYFDRIVFLGDMLDMADWSDHFFSSPEFHQVMQPVVIEMSWFIAKLRETNRDAKMDYLEGNHEDRLNRNIVKHLRAAYNLRPGDELHLPPLLSVDRMLSLYKLDINYVGKYPDGEVWLNDNVVCAHGNIARAASGATTSALVKDYNHSIIFGHIHRIETATKTVHDRKGRHTVTAFSPGCICRIDGVVPGVKARQNWQQGFGIVEYTDDYQTFTPVSINNGKAIYNGTVYEGDEDAYVKKLSADMNYRF